MTEYLLPFIAGTLVAISHSFEVAGFYFRVIGSRKGLGALGYSAHVQIATLSRIGTFIAFPILGFLIDKGDSIYLIIFSMFTYAVIFLLINIAFKPILINSILIEKLFFFIILKINRLKVNRENITAPVKDNNFIYDRKYLVLFAMSSYLMVIGGVFFTFILSAIYRDYRATVLQFGPLLTGIGTIIGAVYFDPFISLIIDKSKNDYEAVSILIKARVLASIVIMVVAIVLTYSNV